MTGNILLFILGLVLLIVGGDKFVDGAVGIAKRFHLPELLIGATVVSIGTTLPEVMVSSQASIEGAGGTAYGNAIGSVICNTALIAAISIAVKPNFIKRKEMRMPVLFFGISTVVYISFAYISGRFSRASGLILLSLFLIYMFFTVKDALRNRTEPDNDNDRSNVNDSLPVKDKLWLFIIYVVIGAAAIAIGARLLVDNGTAIAEKLGVPETVIALTFVALGTSLPELVTAITSLIKGHSNLSLGNIIGANLFNYVLVSGLAITISPFEVPSSKLFGITSSYILDIPVMLAVSTILILPAFIKQKTSRWQGITLIAVYSGFCIMQLFIK